MRIAIVNTIRWCVAIAFRNDSSRIDLHSMFNEERSLLGGKSLPKSTGGSDWSQSSYVKRINERIWINTCGGPEGYIPTVFRWPRLAKLHDLRRMFVDFGTLAVERRSVTWHLFG